MSFFAILCAALQDSRARNALFIITLLVVVLPRLQGETVDEARVVFNWRRPLEEGLGEQQ